MSLMLLDTASLYFRAFFGVPDSLRSPQGEPVNAIRGLLDTVAWLITEHRPDRVVACWDDDWRPAFRVDAIASYKAHRVADEAAGTEVVPEGLAPQIPVIVEVLAAFGIARVGIPGHEADDVIGTLTEREVRRSGTAPGAPSSGVDIVTGDRDLFQLVDDSAGVRVLYPARGVRDPDVVDQAALAARYGVPTGQAYADMATLRGDPSDGLPGVPGIGEKTAAKLLERYGDLAGILRARDDESDRGLTATQRKRLVEAADYLAVAPRVVRVARDAPLPAFDDALPAAPADDDALEALAERWGIRSSVKRVRDALAERTASTRAEHQA
ncbi:5'-3' exonuclease [Myceligenerans pegani]|uniref:5'-3' exonuclease n=1 Tax=Myceligenerans pegani TaxID=2776917 RepID=A0ABR9N4C8_9MICO|nr:5'-3' exonuclease [Myceligenerans sp. TRM 65318]MBE1877959.1 5'-3' exonuclease [Myceligenerans sp. TRM 65318]MBE3020230.1 5'-3' exonuclease [Myceligenerans sp. TRM 65318]